MTLDKELLVFLDQESFDYYDLHSDKVSFCPTHFDAVEAVRRGDTTVVTFSPCMLSFDYADLGYKIYAIKNDRKLECKFNCTMEGNDKEIKRTHNLMKLVLGGAFDDFFENTDNLNPPSAGSVSYYPTYNPTWDWIEKHHTILDDRFDNTPKENRGV